MEKENNKEEKKKGFFAKLFETLDKKLETKAKKTGSCCGPKNNSGTDSLSSQNNGNQCRPSHPPQKENKDLGGPNTDQSEHSGDWGRPNYHSGKKIESLGGNSCCD